MLALVERHTGRMLCETVLAFIISYCLEVMFPPLKDSDSFNKFWNCNEDVVDRGTPTLCTHRISQAKDQQRDPLRRNYCLVAPAAPASMG